MAADWKTKHGGTYTREYRVWADMRQRCTNPNNPRFHKYGGRGIKIRVRWNDFANFLKDMGPRPSSAHSIDRKNNDGNCTPGNCRWATRSKQQRNKGAYPEDNKLRRGGAHWTTKEKARARAIAKRNIQKAHKSGAENGNAKLTPASAAAMRARYAENPAIDLVELGRLFGVCKETARKVIRRISWQ